MTCGICGGTVDYIRKAKAGRLTKITGPKSDVLKILVKDSEPTWGDFWRWWPMAVGGFIGLTLPVAVVAGVLFKDSAVQIAEYAIGFIVFWSIVIGCGFAGEVVSSQRERRLHVTQP